METGRITNAREYLRTSKQTGCCSYETDNTVKIQIHIRNHRNAAQDPIKHQINNNNNNNKPPNLIRNTS